MRLTGREEGREAGSGGQDAKGGNAEKAFFNEFKQKGGT